MHAARMVHHRAGDTLHRVLGRRHRRGRKRQPNHRADASRGPREKHAGVRIAYSFTARQTKKNHNRLRGSTAYLNSEVSI